MSTVSAITKKMKFRQIWMETAAASHSRVQAARFHPYLPQAGTAAASHSRVQAARFHP